MIQVSPSLESLSLPFANSEIFQTSGHEQKPDLFFQKLNHTFSQLCELQMTGDLLSIDWSKMLIQASQPDPTCSFFLRHPHIHMLEFECDILPDLSIPHDTFQTLFPSLRHFTGPSVISTALAKSDISLQLEGLVIMDQWNYTEWMPEVADRVICLPNLCKHLQTHIPRSIHSDQL